MLEQADRDYKGHRIAAMKLIEAATELEGVNVRGDGRVHEKQAPRMLNCAPLRGCSNKAQTGLNGKGLRHVEMALEQLSIALSIK